MRSPLLVCVLVLLSACDRDSDDSSSGAEDFGDDSVGPDDSGKGDDSGASVDADNDGYDSTEDCDDANAHVNPGATEVCDEVDNNCVDGIDEGLTTPFYADADGDTYGAGTAVEACTAPTGHVENADDCDDTTAAACPGGTEVCDGIDNDCAGGIDDGVTTPFYADVDGDSYGAGAAVDECAAPTGYVENADDCDDLDNAAHPGATEVCDDIDNDCDAAIDDDDSGVRGGTNFWEDADGDGYGNPHVATRACEMPSGYVDNADDCDDHDAYTIFEDKYYDGDLDGYGDSDPWYTCYTSEDYVTETGDCDDDDNRVYPGAVEVCDEVDNDCNKLVDEDDKGIVYVTSYADADLDGYGDDSTAEDTCDPAPPGSVTTGGDCDDGEYLVSPGRDEYCDGIDNNCDGTADETADYVDWYRDDDGDHYGDDGDVVNDCAPPAGYDLRGGDCDDSDAAVNPDAEEDVCGDDVDADCDGYVDNCQFDIDDAGFTLLGTAYSFVGYSVGSGDVDGDGTDDLLVGTPYVGVGGEGAIYLVHGPATGGISISDVDATIVGQSCGAYCDDYLGSAVTAGDVDGDGYDDVLAAAVESSRVFLFLGPVTSTTTASADVSFTPTATSGSFGNAIALADLDGDTYFDTAIAEPYDSTSYGAVSIFMGPVSGAANLIVTGSTMYDGMMVAKVGDVDGDGLDELAMAQPDGGSSGQGEVTLLDPGSSTGTVTGASIAVATLTGEASDQRFGYKIAGGDFNGDGYDDLFTASPEYDEDPRADDSVGRVYGWLGPVSGAYAASSADVMVTGEDVHWGEIGRDLALGDVRGDGADEVVIGHPYAVTSSGKAYVLDGPTTGSIDLSAAATLGYPSNDYSFVGWAVGIIGDWSGDGKGEVIIGAYGVEDGPFGYDAGRTWVVASEDL